MRSWQSFTLKTRRYPDGSAAGGAGDGVAVIDGGKSQVTELSLQSKGEYVFVCFITDRAGGPPPVAKGMMVAKTLE